MLFDRLCSAHVLAEVHQHLGHLGAGRGALGIQDAVPLAGEHLRVDRHAMASCAQSEMLAESLNSRTAIPPWVVS